MVISLVLIAPSGRVYFRHSSGMGSVMIFNDRGIWRKVLILDAKYRACKTFGFYGIRIPEFQDFQLEEPNRYWLDYPTVRSTEAPDSWISENIARDPMTSRERCDIWMKYKNVIDRSGFDIFGSPAVQHCRSIQVNGISCDLPNIQTLARIYVDREIIDQMDPTIDKYSKWSLKEWSFSSVNFAWSPIVYLRSLWYIYRSSHCASNYGYYYGGVIPILEL